jgi:hypothetical protein
VEFYKLPDIFAYVFPEPDERINDKIKVKMTEQEQRALNVFNSTTLVSELPDSFAYVFPEPDERINDKIKMKMTEQEQIAKNLLEESQVQARYSKHSRG